MVGNFIVLGGSSICYCCYGISEFHVNKEVAIYAICVALSMIPSSLIVVLTITMAVGAQVMVTKMLLLEN